MGNRKYKMMTSHEIYWFKSCYLWLHLSLMPHRHLQGLPPRCTLLLPPLPLHHTHCSINCFDLLRHLRLPPWNPVKVLAGQPPRFYYFYWSFGYDYSWQMKGMPLQSHQWLHLPLWRRAAHCVHIVTIGWSCVAPECCLHESPGPSNIWEQPKWNQSQQQL